jgi:regulator of replication initiation timing
VRTTSLHFRLQNLEKENELLKMENPRLRNEIDRLKIVSIYTVNKHKRKPKRQSRMDNPNTQTT